MKILAPRGGGGAINTAATCDPAWPEARGRRDCLGRDRGRIGIANISKGNAVGPSSRTLVTIGRRDPTYVAFDGPVVATLRSNHRHRAEGGLGALGIDIIPPDGQTYRHTGKSSS